MLASFFPGCLYFSHTSCDVNDAVNVLTSRTVLEVLLVAVIIDRIVAHSRTSAAAVFATASSRAVCARVAVSAACGKVIFCKTRSLFLFYLFSTLSTRTSINAKTEQHHIFQTLQRQSRLKSRILSLLFC